MPLVLLPSSAKRIALQILVIAKLDENSKQTITCSKLASDKERRENCLNLRMKTLEQRRSAAFIISCEHISFFAVIADFERANVY